MLEILPNLLEIEMVELELLASQKSLNKKILWKKQGKSYQASF